MHFQNAISLVMKKILIVLLFFTPFTAKAQSSVYHPFPEDTATWVSDFFYNTCFGYCGSLYYEMKGDTLIGNQTYNKVFKREGEFHYVTTPPNAIVGGNFNGCSYVGGIRQDVATKSVYFRDSSMVTDTLLYDFNLAVGDTITDWYNKSGIQWPLVISSIDSIAINGDFHKRFNFIGFISGMNRSLIEGVGWSGELFGISTGALEIVLACTNTNVTGGEAFINECQLSLDCSLWVSDQIPDHTERTNVFPNPFSDLLHFENTNNDETLLSIYDFTGRLIFQKPITKSFIYPTEKLKPGTYFYQLLSGKKPPQKGVVVKC